MTDTTEPKPVHRYASDYEVDSVGRPFGMMRGDPRGYWVSYDDHAETVQQLQLERDDARVALQIATKALQNEKQRNDSLLAALKVAVSSVDNYATKGRIGCVMTSRKLSEIKDIIAEAEKQA